MADRLTVSTKKSHGCLVGKLVLSKALCKTEEQYETTESPEKYSVISKRSNDALVALEIRNFLS